MKPLKVLSIDFDYFVNATKDEIYDMFPDPNENISISLNNFLWVTHYANQRIKQEHHKGKNLESISIRWEEFNQVKKYLKSIKKMSASSKVIITNSHAHILPPLEIKATEQPIKLLNIDDHSDFYGIGSELNCGNWGNLLYKIVRDSDLLQDSEVNWVCRPDSINLLEEKDLYEEYEGFLTISQVKPRDLASYIEMFFESEVPDIIFLCRSSCWVPPHLDFRFLELKEVLQSYNTNYCRIDEQVIMPRYTSKFKKMVNAHYSQIKDMFR